MLNELAIHKEIKPYLDFFEDLKFFENTNTYKNWTFIKPDSINTVFTIKKVYNENNQHLSDIKVVPNRINTSSVNFVVTISDEKTQEELEKLHLVLFSGIKNNNEITLKSVTLAKRYYVYSETDNYAEFKIRIEKSMENDLYSIFFELFFSNEIVNSFNGKECIQMCMKSNYEIYSFYNFLLKDKKIINIKEKDFGVFKDFVDLIVFAKNTNDATLNKSLLDMLLYDKDIPKETFDMLNMHYDVDLTHLEKYGIVSNNILNFSK